MMWPPPKLIASALTWRGWNARVIRAGSRAHSALLRRFGRVKLIGEDALILTTRGRRSGKETSTPLFYAADADRILIAASFAGSGTLPSWYLNLVGLSRRCKRPSMGVPSAFARASSPMGKPKLSGPSCWQFIRPSHAIGDAPSARSR